MKNTIKYKTILVDIDDTIIDLLPAWCDWLNKHYEVNISLNDIKGWDICSYIPTLTKEQIFEPLGDPLFWTYVKPKLLATTYLKKLFDEGFDIYLCSATHYKTIYPKFRTVVQKYFPFISWDKVIITSNKQMIKADFCIDDGVHNLIGGNYIKLLITQPHNIDFNTEENGIYRVSDWLEIYSLIHSLVDKNEN